MQFDPLHSSNPILRKIANHSLFLSIIPPLPLSVEFSAQLEFNQRSPSDRIRAFRRSKHYD